MRSVFAFPSSTFETAARVLDMLAGRSHMTEGKVEWVVEQALWIRPVYAEDGLWLDWGSEATDRLTFVTGVLPSWGLQIDVSGRIDGHRAVLAILVTLLEGGGHAVDDYSDHPWNVDEILRDEAEGETRGFLRPTTPHD